MDGFPPPAEGQVTLANWRTPPFNRWAFQHTREIVPTADIANDPERVWALPAAPAVMTVTPQATGSFPGCTGSCCPLPPR